MGHISTAGRANLWPFEKSNTRTDLRMRPRAQSGACVTEGWLTTEPWVSSEQHARSYGDAVQQRLGGHFISTRPITLPERSYTAHDVE